MLRTPSSFIPMRSSILAAVIALALVSFTPSAQAGIGGFTKSIKDKAAQAAGQKVESTTGLDGEAVEFNNVILELTSERLDAILAGLKAGKDATSGRPALAARKQKLEAQVSALVDKNGKEMDAAREKRNAAERCRDDAFHAIKTERDEDVRKRLMTDPALRQKMMTLSQQMGMAQTKGDTAEVSRLTREMASLSTLTREDSIAVDKKCGPLPPRHPAEIQIEVLQKETASIDEQIRGMEKNSLASESKASGLSETQFDMALERIQMYLERAKSKSAQHGFTSSELKALAAHREALDAEV
jgi:hypothetical protein